MNDDNEIKKAVDDIVHVLSSFEKYKQMAEISKQKANLSDKVKYGTIASFHRFSHMRLVEDHAKKGRSFLGSLIRYSRNQNYYLPYVTHHALSIKNYLKEHPDLARNYGWDKPLFAQRYRIPGSERFIGIDDVIRKNEESNPDVQSGSAPPVKPPSTPPPPPPTSTPPPSPDNDDDGKNKAPKKWGVYKHNFTNLLEGFDPNDYKKSIKIEKDNTDETSKNTSALMKLRSWLGPYAKMYLPFYAAKATVGTAIELGNDWIDRTPRVLNREMFERLYVPNEYKEQFDIFSGHFMRGGGSMESAMSYWKEIFQFAMDLKIGKGTDKLASIAKAIGAAPGNAEVGNPGAMAMWMLRAINSANPGQRGLAMSILGEDLVNAGILFGERFTRTQAMHNVRRRAEFEKKTATSKLSPGYLGYWLDEGIFNNPRMAGLLLQYQNMSPEERKRALEPYSPKWYDYFSKLADHSFGSGDPYIGIKEVVEKYPEAIRAIEAGATFNINVNQNVYPQTAGDIPKDSAREAGKEIGREIVETTSNAGN